MRPIDKEEILVPILEKYYPSSKPFIENEKRFYKKFNHLIRSDGITNLKENFGVAILIVNIFSTEKARRLLNIVARNKKFEPSPYKGNRPEIDEILFDEDAKFSFKRSVFKSKERIKVKIVEKDTISKPAISEFCTWDEYQKELQKEEDVAGLCSNFEKPISFSFFISIASAEKLNHHIISYIFTTHDEQKTNDQMIEKNENVGEVYVKLSNHKIINLIKDKNEYFREAIKELDNDLAELFIIEKNSFKGLNLWRPEWKEGNNDLEVFKYIKENPYYYFSLLTLHKDIFRRNFKNIMDYLGWGFSASRVHCGLFSRNLYISITLKPLKDRYDYIGHDGTEFRAWEILALQNYLLNRIDICYGKHDHKRTKESDGLVKELNEVYDFNAFIKKIGKGEIWIKFNTYLQDTIGISAYNDLYINRHNNMLEEEDRFENLQLTRINTILSGLIFSTMFITIALFLLDGKRNYYCQLMYNQSISEFGEVAKISMVYTFIIALIFLIIFFYFIIPVMKRLLLRKLI
jgi:hypothetical protein